MSAPAPRIVISAVPRPVSTGYGADHGATVAVGTIAGVVAAGGVPIILPVVPPDLVPGQLEGADGVILSGGHDLAVPLGEGEDQTDRWIDPDRDHHEFAIWAAASDAHLPVLGICRGAQLVNHARGGRLAPHVAGHDAGTSHAEQTHQVEVNEGSRLAAACGAGALTVNTIHHQAVAAPGEGLVVSARAADGLIEAIETAGEQPWFLGVQWHPELLPGLPAGDGPFAALIAAAA